MTLIIIEDLPKNELNLHQISISMRNLLILFGRSHDNFLKQKDFKGKAYEDLLLFSSLIIFFTKS